jgi:hypothetical protein
MNKKMGHERIAQSVWTVPELQACPLWSMKNFSPASEFLIKILCSVDENGSGNDKLVGYWEHLQSCFGSILTPDQVSTLASDLHERFLCYGTFTEEECPAHFAIDSLADICSQFRSPESGEVTSLLNLLNDEVIEEGSSAKSVFQRMFARMAALHVLEQPMPAGKAALFIGEISSRWIAQDLKACMAWAESAKEWQVTCLAFLFGNALRNESSWYSAPRLSYLCDYLDKRELAPNDFIGFTSEILLPSGVGFKREVTPVSEAEFKWQGLFSVPEVGSEYQRGTRMRTVAMDLDFYRDPTGTPEARAMELLVGIPCAVPAYPADVHQADIMDAILSRKEAFAWLIKLEACRLSFSYAQLKEHYNERNNKGVYFLLLTALCWFQRYKADKSVRGFNK